MQFHHFSLQLARQADDCYTLYIHPECYESSVFGIKDQFGTVLTSKDIVTRRFAQKLLVETSVLENDQSFKTSHLDEASTCIYMHLQYFTIIYSIHQHPTIWINLRGSNAVVFFPGEGPAQEDLRIRSLEQHGTSTSLEGAVIRVANHWTCWCWKFRG